MDWIERLNSAIIYIEEHLNEKIEYEELAKILCCSTYHFQRMFAFMNDVPLSEYIRRRRMSLAVADIQRGEKIIDVALKYGYSSPTAFCRSFQSIHGVSPSQARKKGVQLKIYPPISFKLSIKGSEELSYRIEDKKAFQVMGVSMPLKDALEENFRTVPQFWNNELAKGTLSNLLSFDRDVFEGLLGISCVYNDTKDWKYYIAVSSSTKLNHTFEKYIVPASKWAVFSGSGTNLSLQELERRVITEWLPFSGFEYGNAPDIEHYIQADPNNAEYEYWLPIKSVNKE